MTTALTTAPERVRASDKGGPRVGELVERELATAVDGILNRHAAVGFGVGIVRDGRLQAFARNQPVNVLVEAVRALVDGTPAGPRVWQAIAWSVGILAVTVPLAVRQFRGQGIR